MRNLRPRVAIIGAGIMGAAAAWRLAEAGAQVEVFEEGRLGNPLASSAGETRMFRRLYAEGDAYEPLLAGSQRLWRELDASGPVPVFAATGGIILAAEEHPLVTQTLAHARERKLPHELLRGGAIAERFAHLRAEAGEVALFDPQAGVLRSSIAVVRAARLAERRGAVIHERSAVRELRADGAGVALDIAVVDGGARELRFDHAVVATGVRAPELLGDLAFSTRSFAHTWHPLTGAEALRSFPIIMRRGRSDFGAMSALDGSTIKLSPHFAEEEWPTGAGGPADAEAAAIASAEAIARSFTGVDPATVRSAVFTESYTPDGHPYVGGDDRVSVLAGFSGHGFKLAPGFAEAIARRIVSGEEAGLPEVVSPGRPREQAVDIRSAGLRHGAATA